MNGHSKNPVVYYARWTDDRTKPQPLHLHLQGVSRRAESFAQATRQADDGFVAAARIAGLLHDLGKYRTAFQEYLNAGDRGRRSTETAHAVYGAAAVEVEWLETAVSFGIAGHHAGLHDQEKWSAQINGGKFHARDRFPELLQLADGADELAGVLQSLKPKQQDEGFSQWPLDFDEDDPADSRRFEVFVRMLFAILVDADRLDSEKFEQEHRRRRAWERATQRLDPSRLLLRLEAAKQAKGVQKKESCSDLNQLRDKVFAACRDWARAMPTGFSSLTVPTGGGKTYSSMAFALEHARTHGLRRVIVVIPYLSIIEQNAGDYRTIFGADQVLEHHSAVELTPQKTPSTADEDEPPQALDIERAMENWEVPIVVTTAVQFIETLFAASPAKARKLHNVARSVIVFDEVQTLPTHLLEPLLDVLRTLQQQFGVSVLFCSATQPAFLKSGNLRHGFRNGEVQEVGTSPVELQSGASSPAQLFEKLRRVEYHIKPADSPWNWARLAEEMLGLRRQQALAVLNLRQHAFDAFLAVRDRLARNGRENDAKHAVFHLSSAMCPAHRLDLLGLSQSPPPNNIKWRLNPNNPQPCWVISTQLIEAGVDIDFPTVFRAMGPLDSIVQAAGRCNREGKLRDEAGDPIRGDVIIFHPEVTSERSALPPGIYSKATGIAPKYLTDTDRVATDPELFAKYFKELFQITATDHVVRGEDTIQQSRAKLNFRTVAERAKVIADDTIAVIVPYGRAAKLIDVIRRKKRLDHHTLRRLQRYMVSLRRGPKSLYQQLDDEGMLRPLLSDIADIPVLDANCYDDQRGVVFKQRPPEDWVQ